ncbi:hypothetical protein PCE1_000661 [Barthelona sp. PCE]
MGCNSSSAVPVEENIEENVEEKPIEKPTEKPIEQRPAPPVLKTEEPKEPTPVQPVEPTPVQPNPKEEEEESDFEFDDHIDDSDEEESDGEEDFQTINAVIDIDDAAVANFLDDDNPETQKKLINAIRKEGVEEIVFKGGMNREIFAFLKAASYALTDAQKTKSLSVSFVASSEDGMELENELIPILAHAIRGNTSLEKVFISANRPEILVPLLEAIAENTSITTLSLWLSTIYNRVFEALVNAFKVNNRIHKLIVRGTRIRRSGYPILFEGLAEIESLQSLSIKSFPVTKTFCANLLKYMETVKGLGRISFRLKTEENSREFIAALTSGIAKADSIRALSLNSIDFNEDQWDTLFRLLPKTNINDLELDECEVPASTSSRFARALSKMRLTRLFLPTNGFDGLAFDSLINNYTHHGFPIRELVLDNNDNLQENVIVELIKKLSGSPTLKILSLQGSFGDAVALAVADLMEECLIEDVSLAGCDLSEETLSALFEAASKSGTLHKLDLADTGMSDSSCGTLAQTLSQLEIDHIDLSHNNIYDDGLEALGKAFSEMEGKTCSLRVLELDHNNFGNNGATALSEGLRTPNCHKLQRITLNDANYDAEGLGALIDILRGSATIERLEVDEKAAGEMKDDIFVEFGTKVEFL